MSPMGSRASATATGPCTHPNNVSLRFPCLSTVSKTDLEGSHCSFICDNATNHALMVTVSHNLHGITDLWAAASGLKLVLGCGYGLAPLSRTMWLEIRQNSFGLITSSKLNCPRLQRGF